MAKTACNPVKEREIVGEGWERFVTQAGQGIVSRGSLVTEEASESPLVSRFPMAKLYLAPPGLGDRKHGN